jgi:hypothetical protein
MLPSRKTLIKRSESRRLFKSDNARLSRKSLMICSTSRPKARISEGCNLSRTCAHARMRAQARIHVHARTHAHVRACVHTRARVRICAHTRAHARMGARMGARTQTLCENDATAHYGPQFPRLKQGLSALTAVTVAYSYQKCTRCCILVASGF